MSLRLDPRRAGALKHLAGEAGMRPGDLVRQWVEERIDASRGGAQTSIGGGLAGRLDDLARRVAALEAAAGSTVANGTALEARPEPEVEAEPASTPDVVEPKARRQRRNAAAAAPGAGGARVALHDEMIAVLRERGEPMTAAELAGAIAERGRYSPPRSGKPLDAAMVSQRVSNPTYRSRFLRSDGRIGLAE